MREEIITGMSGWGIALGGDAPPFDTPSAFVMVTTFLTWSTG